MALNTLEAFVDECCINSDSIDYDLAADEEEGRAELTIGYEEDGYAIEVEYEITQKIWMKKMRVFHSDSS